MNNHIKEVCKIGQGKNCCKYVGCGSKGFECLKLEESIKSIIDKRDNMVAKSDNCEGKSNLNDI